MFLQIFSAEEQVFMIFTKLTAVFSTTLLQSKIIALIPAKKENNS